MKPGTIAARGLLLFAVTLTILSACANVASTDPEPVMAPPNPAFVDYLQNPYAALRDAAASEYVGGLVPEPFDLSGVRPASVISMASVDLPLSYDLRSGNKLTGIRNQGQCGSCWAFAAIGSLESFLMPGESWDFSENNLKNLSGFDTGCCLGGDRVMSTAYLARWAGPVAESDDLYKPGSCVSPAGLVPQKHVQDVIFLPNRSGPLDNDALKRAVMTYGAVYTTYFDSRTYYNDFTSSYYYSGSTRANHGVCIVGWNDNYPASDFLVTPPGSGAFRIRNSWGTQWGLNGYYWISYYDNILGKSENAVFTAEPATNYDEIYQYDPLGWVANTGYGNTGWFANVFTASSNSAIKAASWYTPKPNASYSLYVYVDPASGPLSSTGPAVSVTGTLGAAGYHTVQLPAGVAVTAGEKFSVVVRLTTVGYSYPICVERPYASYSSSATASPGQSYMSGNGLSWTDVTTLYANTNVCLKAFASTSGTATPGALSVTPSAGLSATGTVGGPFSPASQAYKLTNTGGSAIDWTASASQAWVGLTTTSGTLAAGASATVTVSIDSSASTLATGAYADTVSFANTATGSVNITRSVSLTVDPAPEAGALSVTPSAGLSASGNAGGPFSPASQAYTLTNTGGSAIDWTAGATMPWVGLSSGSGNLAAGASATVAVSIDSSADILAAGAYTDAVSFANTTNGAGSTTRSVSLSVLVPGSPPGGYQIIPTTYGWIDPVNHTKLTLSDDSVSAVQTMPFMFTFYGKRYFRLYVGSNGLLGFTSTGMTLHANTDIPSASVPNAAICPYWDDLNPANGASVRIGTVGSAPNRKLVISWLAVPPAHVTTARFTFQAILCESTNDIVFQYQNVAPTNVTDGAGAGATVGIEDETGSQACKFSYNTKSLANGMAIRFTTLPTSARQGIHGGWESLRR